MGATKIMIIRHAEKPGSYNGQAYDGVNATGTQAGTEGAEHLVTLGWQRAGALVTLFAKPWGPKNPDLATPQFLFASKPTKDDDNSSEHNSDDHQPSQRPYETLIPLASALGSNSQAMAINLSYSKKQYDEMIADTLSCNGTVLICWQHEDIPLLNDKGKPGLSQCILTQTQTQSGVLNIPTSWPKGPNGARYDLVWIFDRPSGTGPITHFALFAQCLLAGDSPAPSSSLSN